MNAIWLVILLLLSPVIVQAQIAATRVGTIVPATAAASTGSGTVTATDAPPPPGAPPTPSSIYRELDQKNCTVPDGDGWKMVDCVDTFIGVIIVTVTHHATCTDLTGKTHRDCSYGEPVPLYVGTYPSLAACDAALQKVLDRIIDQPKSVSKMSTTMCVQAKPFAWPK